MSGTTVDLTTQNSEGTIGGAIFSTNVDQPTGTGFINSFVRVQDNGEEDGFNTSANVQQVNAALGTDMLAGNFTRDINLGDVPVVTRDGVQYLEFRLDINEPSGGENELLSLDELQIFLSPTGGLTTLAGLTPLYDLDAGGDSKVLMDYSLNSGSGSGDVTVLIPQALFAGQDPGSFLYLYSQFGLTEGHEAGDGFEEWAIREAEDLPEEPPPPGEPPPTVIDVKKDFDVNINLDANFDVTLTETITTDIDVKMNLSELEGNAATLAFGIDAVGDSSLTEATFAILVTDGMSSTTGEFAAYVG